jgi:hypothetical protein
MSDTDAGTPTGEDRSVMFAVTRNGQPVAYATIDATADGLRVHTTGTPKNAWQVFNSRPRAAAYAKAWCQHFKARAVLLAMSDPQAQLSLREVKDSYTIVRSVIPADGAEGPMWAPTSDPEDQGPDDSEHEDQAETAGG